MGVRLLQVAADFVVMQGQERGVTWGVARNPLPGDARLLGVWADPRLDNTFLLKLESAAWTDIPPGCQVPFLDDIVFMSFAVRPSPTEG